MSDRLRDREKGEELRFEMEQEMRFKAESRRNRLLGQWLAERFGLPASEVDAYVREVMAADLDEPGVEDLMRKVMADIEKQGAKITEVDVRAKLEELYAVALEHVREEFKPSSV